MSSSYKTFWYCLECKEPAHINPVKHAARCKRVIFCRLNEDNNPLPFFYFDTRR